MKWAILLSLPLAAQSLKVYSELARFNPLGSVTSPAHPREILSPALVRNGFTSFQISVQVEPGTPYSLVVGENPEDAVKLTLYRESGGRLEPVEMPYAGQESQIFWLDVWTAGAAPVRRIKVEPQMFVKNDWVVYPMEARVMSASVPENRATENLLCSASADTPFRIRNALQDAALAALAPKEELGKLAAACASNLAADPESYLPIRDYLFRMR